MTLLELLVAMVILVEILIGVLILFDNSNQLARSQVNLAELQQSLRVSHQEISRTAGMAGRGGLPASRAILPASPDYNTPGVFPGNGVGLRIENGVPDGRRIDGDDANSDLVLTGSDILTVRGVLTTPIYYITNLGGTIDIDSWAGNAGGTLEIPSEVNDDMPQDLQPLIDALTAAASAAPPRPEALIVRDVYSPNAFAIFGFDATNSDLTPKPCTTYTARIPPPPPPPPPSGPPPPAFTPLRCITVALSIDSSHQGSAYSQLTRAGTALLPGTGGIVLPTPDGPPDDTIDIPKSIGSIGLLEEYRYFVRAEWEIPGDDTSRLTPVLSRARFLPNTEVLVSQVDIADNVVDLQIAIGADSDRRSFPPNQEYGRITDNGDETDEVLFNSPDDVDGSGNLVPPNNNVYPNWFDPGIELHYLRVNIVTQSDRADSKLDPRAFRLGLVEDFDRGAPFNMDGRQYDLNDGPFRRRHLQTIVELRDLM